jgi:hypothetical protein
MPKRTILEGTQCTFDTNINNQRAKDLVQYIKDGYFMDEYTNEVKIKAVTYNLNAKVFISSEVTFVWDAGGRILMEQLIQPFRETFYTTESVDVTRFSMEIIFLFFVFWRWTS